MRSPGRYKGFFLAYMVMALPTAGTAIFTYDQFDILTNPVHFLLLLIGLAMYADVCFGTVGYALTFRILSRIIHQGC